MKEVKENKLIENNCLQDVIEYPIFDDEIKNKINNNVQISEKVKQWLDDNNNSWTKAVKNCYVEYIDYESLDFDNMDELEVKHVMRIIKKNKSECPNHINCAMFQSNLLKPGMKCPLETLECYKQTNKLYEELDIKDEDANDQILLSQMVGLQMVFNRSMLGLANTPLVSDIKKVTNGGITYDTKVNEHFNIAKTVLSSIESLRKSLILNRNDKQKIKKIKEGKNIDEVKKNTIDIINNHEEEFNIAEIVSDVEATIKNTEKAKKTEENTTDALKDIDA